MTAVGAPSSRDAAVGVAGRKVDADLKVTGEFAYASDLHAAGMLYGATVRSPHPHARILDVDVDEARRMPGVRRVMTHRDVPGDKRFGLEFRDQPVLAGDRVLYHGEPVAVLAAESPEQARRAAAAVHVRYEPLSPIVDPELATESAPLHPDRPTDGHGYREDPRPNVIRRLVIRHGDPDATGDVAVSGIYEVGMQDQAFLGPEACLAVPDGEGGVDIHVATQWVHSDREQIAPCLGLAHERVRVHLAGVGGAFGGREDVSGQIHAALLALATGRPVRFSYSREESFLGHVHRHPARMWAEHRADREGRIVCVRMRLLLDGGAYASTSAAVTSNAACFACGAYDVPNALIDATTVYTNNPPNGAMRGFGVVQSCFAAEAQMDRLAARLGIDPVDLRLRNALAPGDVLPTGQRVTGVLPVADVIRRCAELPVPERAERPGDLLDLPGGAGNASDPAALRHGTGIAVAIKNMGFSEGFPEQAAARVRLYRAADDELVAEVHSGASELGQGVTNVMAQVVGTELEVARVVIAPHSTATVGSAGSTSASRQTWMTAGAVQLACRAVREELERRGGLPQGGEIDVERTYHAPRTSALDPETGQATGERAHIAFACAAMKAVVQTDVELGLVRVTWLGTVQDVGLALNPPGLEGQIEGGSAQGLGLALMEEVRTGDGRVLNPSFTDYLIPTTLDMPDVAIELIEERDPEAPYGVKGAGELPAIVALPAVVAALRDATGRELARVPVRPDDIALG